MEGDEAVVRQLNIIPIIHTETDLGKLAPQVELVKGQLSSKICIDASKASVKQFWSELKRAVQEWQIPFESVNLYQDALPYTETEDASIEKMIVEDLAQKGSQNHQLLKWIMSQGAKLIGTESPKLLLAEYELMKQQLELLASDSAESGHTAGNDTGACAIAKATQLLSERDQFIAHRIDETLTDDSIGIIFIGMMHALESKIASDILVKYPFGGALQASI